MARFLITVWPFYGHLFPNIALAQALRHRGHQVAFYTGPEVCPLVEREGFTCFPFQQVPGENLRQLVSSVSGRNGSLWGQHQKQLAVWRRLLVDTLPAQLSDLNQVLKLWPPDVIICDPTLWGPILVLHETEALPVAVYSWTVGCMLPGPGAPPAGLGWPPPKTWLTRGMARIVATVIRALTVNIRRRANELRRDYGLPPLTQSVAAYAGHMPLYLVTSTPALDYNRQDLPPGVRYVGPCLWSDLHAAGRETWLATLPADRPVVYVSEGTLHNQALPLVRAAATGLANLPMQVVMTRGGADPVDLPALDSLAPNIRLEDWVPDSQLIPRSDVVVTAGGASTVLAALQAGVPLVVVPTYWDKPENAQRVAASGAGIRLAPRRCTPGRLRQAVERVLAEPSFRQQAQRLATALKARGGPARAAELLEGLATPDPAGLKMSARQESSILI